MSNDTEEVVVAVLAAQPTFGDETMISQSYEIEAAASSLTITNDAEFKKAVEMGSTIQQAIKKREEFIKPMEKAASDALKQVRERKAMLLNPLKNAKNILANAVNAYNAEVERRRMEAERIARTEALAEAERQIDNAIVAESCGDSAGEAAAFSAACDAELAARNVTVTAATPKVSGSVRRTVYEITDVDPSKVPTTFGGVNIRPVDITAVKKLISNAAGQIEIPGIKFVKSEKISFRA